MHIIAHYTDSDYTLHAKHPIQKMQSPIKTEVKNIVSSLSHSGIKLFLFCKAMNISRNCYQKNSPIS